MGAGQQTIHIRDQLRHTSTHPPKLTRQKPPHHNRTHRKKVANTPPPAPRVGNGVCPISGVSGFSLASVEVGHSVGECYCESVQRGLPAHRPALLTGALGIK